MNKKTKKKNTHIYIYIHTQQNYNPETRRGSFIGILNEITKEDAALIKSKNKHKNEQKNQQKK